MKYKFLIFSITITNLFGNDINGIIGKDNRIIINKPNKDKRTKDYKIGLIKIYKEDNKIGQCSGTLISKNIVLTAAHCFYNNKTKKFANKNILFTLQSSKNYKPYKEEIGIKYFLNENFIKNYKKTNSKSSIYKNQINYDYAFLFLKNNIGEKYGWNEIEKLKNYKKEEVKLLSYPGDKNKKLTYEECLINIKKIEGYNLTSCDIYKGASGSAIFNKNKKIIGVISSTTETKSTETTTTRNSKKEIISQKIIKKDLIMNNYANINDENYLIMKNWLLNHPTKETIVKKLKVNNYKGNVLITNNCNGKNKINYKIKIKNKWIENSKTIQPHKDLLFKNVMGDEFYYFAKTSFNNTTWTWQKKKINEKKSFSWKNLFSFLISPINNKNISKEDKYVKYKFNNNYINQDYILNLNCK
jgi:V8-like Glu-specific endopeptidase